MSALTTIGYEGAGLDDFLATLQAADVTTLIDVRQLPVSRRKGFSKKVLAEALIGSGIEYVHLVGLGDPKEGRDAARSGRKEEFLAIFNAHMKIPEAQADLKTAAYIVERGGACLMCYERSPDECHRKLIVDALSDIMEVEIKHLGVREGIARNGAKTRARTRTHARQGVAACR